MKLNARVKKLSIFDFQDKKRRLGRDTRKRIRVREPRSGLRVGLGGKGVGPADVGPYPQKGIDDLLVIILCSVLEARGYCW